MNNRVTFKEAYKRVCNIYSLSSLCPIHFDILILDSLLYGPIKILVTLGTCIRSLILILKNKNKKKNYVTARNEDSVTGFYKRHILHESSCSPPGKDIIDNIRINSVEMLGKD